MTRRCLKTLLKTIESQNATKIEVLVVDNASHDKTISDLQKIETSYKEKNVSLTIIRNSENLGYSKANNKGAALAQGKYFLFLNSDVIVNNISFEWLIERMEKDSNTAALTIQVLLEQGKLDWASHRGFPTIWRSFCYFAGLEKIFGRIPLLDRVFGGYHLTFLNLKKSHEIDSATGAFYLVRKEVFDKVDGFDESFFMYGEDLDLSFRIKQLGYKIMYDPKYKVDHLKYQSGFQSPDAETKEKTKKYFYDAMKIFYDKHYAKRTSPIFNRLIYWVIEQKAKRS